MPVHTSQGGRSRFVDVEAGFEVLPDHTTTWVDLPGNKRILISKFNSGAMDMVIQENGTWYHYRELDPWFRSYLEFIHGLILGRLWPHGPIRVNGREVQPSEITYFVGRVGLMPRDIELLRRL